MSEFPFLILSAGRRVELARLFAADAKSLGFEPRFLTADRSPELSAACSVADKSFRVPPASSGEYVDAVLYIVRREGIRLVVPTIDPELEPLAARRGDFVRDGALLSISNSQTVRIARDKIDTARHLAAAGVMIPRTAMAADVLKEPSGWAWPIFVKPRKGSSSIGAAVVEDAPALSRALKVQSDLVAQEFVRGREFTINVFCSAAGDCRAAIPHFRREVRGGEVSKGIVVDDPELRQLARKVMATLPGSFGALCLQAIASEDGVKVLEINARFGGGFPLAHRAGGKFTRWLIELTAGLPCSAHDEWHAGTAMLRYDAAVFEDIPSGAARDTWSK